MTTSSRNFVPENIEVFNESTFFPRFLDDIRNAKALVILQSPYISLNLWTQLSEDFRACVERHVCVCVFLQERNDCAEFQNCLLHLRSSGVHINVRPAVHEKLAIIDERVLWDGCLNVLSHRNTHERMSRIVSREMAISAMVEHGVNRCDLCMANRGGMILNGGTANMNDQLELIGARIRSRRLAFGMSQLELAKRAGVTQQAISLIETGARASISLGVFCNVCHHLDLEMRPVPWFHLPILDSRS